MIAVRRLEIEVEGERVVVAPWTLAEMQAFPAGADEDAMLRYFATHVETPADFLERDILFLTVVLKGWQEQITALSVAVRGLTGHLPPSGRRH